MRRGINGNMGNYTNSLKAKIGQMIVVRASGYLFDHQIRYPTWEATQEKLRSWIENWHIGGVILLGGSAGELSLRSQQLQSWAQIPLFIAADIEEGVGQRFSGATWFPPPMALGAIASTNPYLAQEYAKKMGAITAQEALAIGINWLFAPTVDVNNNPENPVINVRSFGETPEVVGSLATAFIQGAKQYPVLTTAKHFPGHGDTATDSHLALPVLPHSAPRLAQVEIPPFQRAIAAGVDSVMTAHLLIPAWDEQRPATLSPAILTGELRHQLDFRGLIVTDALIMGAIAKFASPEEMAVMAVEAGADVLLMPPNPEITINAIYQAVKSGRLTESRLEESFTRIQQAKQKINSPVHSTSDTLLTQLAQPAARETAAAILAASMQVSHNLPLAIPKTEATNLILVDDLLNADFIARHTPAVVIPQKLGYRLRLVEQNNLPLSLDECSDIFLQVFIRGNPFRGNAGLVPHTQVWLKNLLKTDSVQGLMVYGSPYVAQWLQTIISPHLPYIFCYGQMPLAQKIAWEKFFNLSGFFDFRGENFL